MSEIYKETNSRPTIARTAGRAGETWVAVEETGRGLTKEKQPHADLQWILHTFLAAEDGISSLERTILGDYLDAIHGCRLQLGDRVFAIVQRNCRKRDGVPALRYHLRELNPPSDAWAWRTCSVFDGKPFRGPLINLYGREIEDATIANPNDRFHRASGLRRGKLGALLFGALESSGQTRWPRSPSESLVAGASKYFGELQIVPGVSATQFLFFRELTLREATELASTLRRVSGFRQKAAAFLLLDVKSVDGRRLVLSGGGVIRLNGRCLLPGWGRKFNRAIALVSFAQGFGESTYGYQDAFVMPLTACAAGIPVESSYEADVYSALVRLVNSLNASGQNLTLRKPLYCKSVNGKLIRPDVEIWDLSEDWRCYVEVRGFPDESYQTAKDDAERTLRSAYTTVEVVNVQAHGFTTPGKRRDGLVRMSADVRRAIFRCRESRRPSAD